MEDSSGLSDLQVAAARTSRADCWRSRFLAEMRSTLDIERVEMRPDRGLKPNHGIDHSLLRCAP